MSKLIYLGCLSDKLYEPTCKNAIKIIQFLDSEYKVIENPPCCGSLAFNITSDDLMKNHVESVNEWFKTNNITELVTICAGCYSYFTRYYKEFLGSEFSVKIRHFLQFLAEPHNLETLNSKIAGKSLKVNYHDACHLRNSSVPIIEEPRIILNSIDNIELVEMDFNKTKSICCGAGGGVYSIFRENSDYNGKLIFDNMKKGEVLLTACPFCYTALSRVKEDNNIRKPVIKFEDFIVKLMEGVDPIS
ncbi:MAG: (Fe-S)-binding protein [Candidatus Lokiarchaeota archaeon]|nr:(Fe-S)-binding protein [Candidatus Lokiarchaeota archaeon]